MIANDCVSLANLVFWPRPPTLIASRRVVNYEACAATCSLTHRRNSPFTSDGWVGSEGFEWVHRSAPMLRLSRLYCGPINGSHYISQIKAELRALFAAAGWPVSVSQPGRQRFCETALTLCLLPHFYHLSLPFPNQGGAGPIQHPFHLDGRMTQKTSSSPTSTPPDAAVVCEFVWRGFGSPRRKF